MNENLIEFDPDASINLLKCVKELVAIQYFHDCPHKHRAWAWDALNYIAPTLAELAANDPKQAHDIINKYLDLQLGNEHKTN